MRPGILKEWPLDEFLGSSLTQTQPPWSPMKKSHKRPLSPSGASVLLSPTKRRILAQEGILSPESVLKRERTPASSLFAATRPSSAPLSSPVLAPIPTRRTKSAPQTAPNTESLRLPLPDPTSIHYPGFDVHRDIVASERVETVDGSESCEEDDFKENLPAVRRARKGTSTASIKPLVLSPALPKIELHTPATPSKKAALDRLLPGSPTPRRSVQVLTGSRHASPVVSETERKERRRLLEHEVDHPDTVSDSDSERDEDAL